MKSFVFAATLAMFAVSNVFADDLYELDQESAVDPRIFFVNFTSSLVQVNATILAYGLLFLGILAAAAIALYYLYLESQSSGGYGYGYGYQSGNSYGYHQYARYVYRFSGHTHTN